MNKQVQKYLWYLLMILLALVIVAPILSALATALTPSRYLFESAGKLIPTEITLDNFRRVLDEVPMKRWYLNSIIVATLYTIGHLFHTSLAGYALACTSFPGRNIVLIVAISTLMVPFHVVMVPMFTLMRSLGWINTLYPLFVPSFLGELTSAFGIFLFRQAFLGIPVTLKEAGIVDGCNHWQIFRHIYMPLSKQYIAIVAVFSFMTSWNDFIKPITYITNINMITVTGGLSFFRTAWHVEWTYLMAGTLLSMIPTLILYALAQKYFVRSVVSSGIKG